MHLAGAEGRLLAVSYLLGVSANPNGKDRWGGTPMDDCVRGGTQRHLQCAKLLQCLGGRLGTLVSTPQGREAMHALTSIEMEDVREVIKLLIDHGLDSKKPERATFQECVIAFEASVELMSPAFEIARVFNIVTGLLRQEQNNCQELLECVKKSLKSMANFVDTVLPLHEKTAGGKEKANGEQKYLHVSDAKEFVRVLESGEDPESLDHFFDSEIDQHTLQLYDELDFILSEQEREKFGSRSVRVHLAKDFNRCLMNLYKVEEMWRVLRLAFVEVHTGNHKTSFHCPRQHQSGLDQLSMAKVLEYFDFNPTDEEVRQIYHQSVHSSATGMSTPESLLVDSPMFQNRLLEDDSDDISQLLYHSQILKVLSWQSMHLLSPYARRVKVKAGQTIRLKERAIVAIQSGSVSATFLDENCTQQLLHMERGDVAGEAWAILDVGNIVSVLAHTNSSMILLSFKSFANMFEMRPELYIYVCSAFIVMMEKADKNVTGLNAAVGKMIRGICKETNKKRGHEKRSSLSFDDLQGLQGKSAEQQDRDHAVRRVMDHTRDSCRVDWTDSYEKQALIAFSLWKNTFTSKLRKHAESIEYERRLTLRAGFEVIESSWTVIANGANTIFLSQLGMLKEHIGEVGVAFFVEAFPADLKEELEFCDWVTCWIRYLGGDEVDAENSQDLELENVSVYVSVDGQGPQPGHTSTTKSKQSNAWVDSNFLLKHLVNAFTVKHLVNAFQVLRHTPIAPLLEDSEIARAYAPSYAAITGDIRTNLDRSKVIEFLALLLIDFDHELTERHVVEFMVIFSPDGAKGESVTWSDIERGLRERTNSGLDPRRLFMAGLGTTLNPGSPYIRFLRSSQQAAALFMFTHVPVRIAFNPYATMTSWECSMLTLDLCVDCVVFFNLILNFNIAYMNKKSRWVTDREKIARHYLSQQFWIDLLCATPFDWFGFLSGASQRLSSCFRLPKMLFVYSVFKDSREGLLTSKHVGSQVSMIIYILMLLHCGTCVFFLLGNDVSKDDYSWYHYPANESVEWSSLKFEYLGFGYLQDPDNEPLYRVWKQYLLSFYWVTSTVTTTGVIGDMYPKNYNEVLFTHV